MTGNDDLRFPIGRFVWPVDVSAEQVRGWIDDIARHPRELRDVVTSLTPAQLEVPYRPDGWCSRQVVHHLVDSHVNSYIRFKWALTEPRPLIKTYFEDRWAELPDSLATPIETSLRLLEALHERWTVLLRALGPAELARELEHPEWGIASLDRVIAMYAWHGRHHVAHITHLVAREGWTQDR
ncbi:MAG: putative metal-dependent hydrolase [bacterium]